MLRTLALSAAPAACFAGAALADMVKWTAKLDQAQEGDFKTKVGGAKGDASGTLDAMTGALTWEVTWPGLSGDATMMHLHGPAPVGTKAGVQVDIGKISRLKSPAKGKATITPDQVQQVMDGVCYVNVHTAANPGGECEPHCPSTSARGEHHRLQLAWLRAGKPLFLWHDMAQQHPARSTPPT